MCIRDRYYDGAWEVEIPKTINQIFYKPPANTVYALDNENNIWAWGEGFGSTPEIYFNADDASSY